MSDNKKYYYLKLKDNFFDSDEMIIVESMQDGYIYSNILLKLYLRSLKNDGKLMLNDKIPFNSNMLAQVTRVSVGTLEKAVKIFKDLGLIEILDNGAIFMSEIHNFIGNSSSEADRKRQYRKKIDAEKIINLTLKDKCPDKNPPEIEIEKDLKIDIKKKIEKKTNNNYKKFIEFLKEKATIPSKVTSTRKGEELYKGIDDKKKLIAEYLEHQEEKGEFAKRITAYMEDYKATTKETVRSNSLSYKNHFFVSKSKFDEWNSKNNNEFILLKDGSVQKRGDSND